MENISIYLCIQVWTPDIVLYNSAGNGKHIYISMYPGIDSRHSNTIVLATENISIYLCIQVWTPDIVLYNSVGNGKHIYISMYPGMDSRHSAVQ